MTVSVVKIANMALGNIGAKSTIESLTEASTEAKQINLWYEFARQQTLSALDWSFARKRKVLALHSEAADLIKWQYRYQVPSDVLTIRYIPNPAGPDADAIPFELALNSDGTQQTILTNLPSAEIVYTFDQTLVNLYSPMFVQALSLILAHYISYTLISRKDVKSEMLGQYVAMLRVAEATDGNSQVKSAPREASWISGR